MSPRKVTIRDLGTEQPNRASSALDTLSALDIARVINREDRKIAAAVKRVSAISRIDTLGCPPFTVVLPVWNA